MRCDHCRYWMPKSEGAEEAECRRNPPSPLLMTMKVGLNPNPQLVVNFFYSRTGKGSFCGEFKEGVPGLLGKEEESHEVS
jgi:hypothetical protein